MRICWVAPASAAEDGDLMAARLRGLLELGWDARLLCEGERWARDRAIRDPALAANVEVMSERSWYPPPRALFRRPRGLVGYLREWGRNDAFDQRLVALRPDLVHFHSAAVALKAIRLRRILDCRVVVGFRGDGSDLDAGFGVEGRRLDRPNPQVLWEEADLLVFPDPQLRDRAIAWGCSPQRAAVLPPPARSRSVALDGRKPPSGSFRVISIGPLSWEQGLAHSVHAIRLLLDMGVSCRYRIVGEGEHMNAVAFARHQYDLAEVVDLVPPDDAGSLAEELLAADVLLDPAVTGTTSPTPLRTAAALGLPFVATHRDGLPPGAGIAVSRRNAREIAAALRKLADDAGLRGRMSEAGRAEANGQPTLEQHLGRLQDLYQRALA